MRWVPFLILVALAALLQRTAGLVLTFSLPGVGSVGPDLLAAVAVFVACRSRAWEDAVLAAWVLGLAVDVTAGGAGVAVGPMSVAYALAAWVLFRIREAFFHERAVTQALLALIFCLLAHGTWVTAETLLGGTGMAWADYGSTMLQAVLLAVYTAALTPLVHAGLWRCRRLILAAPTARGARR